MSRVTKNIIYSLAGQCSTLVLSFVAVKYIFGNLGTDILGIIYLTTMLNAMILMALNMGLSATTMREVSMHHHDDPDYVRKLIRTLSSFYWMAFILLGIVFYLMTPVIIDKWINLTSLNVSDATYCLRILAISSLIVLPRTLYFSLFNGLQRMEYNNAIDVAINVIRQLGIIVLLGIGGNVYHIVYLYMAVYVLHITVYFVLLTKFFPIKAFIPGYSTVVIKRNINFTAKLALNTVILAIHGQLDKIIISKFLPIGVLGYYSFSQTTVQRTSLLESSATNSAYPSFCEMISKGGNKSAIHQYRKLHDLVSYGVVPCLAIIPFAIIPLFSYVFNKEVAVSLLLPVTLLCIGCYMFCSYRVPTVFALAVGKPGIGIRADIYSLFLVLPLAYILINQFGLTGAGLAIIARRLVHYAYAIPRYYRECLDLPVKEWYWNLLKIIILVFLSYGVAWLILSVVDNYSVFSLAIAYVCATIIFMFGSYMVIGEEFRETISRYVNMLKPKAWEVT